MRIVYLELENIKSYAGRTRLEFTEGLNAISGHNGSGKSTVLEAIGWALFNSLPYKRDGFLREGERSGSVRVGLVAADSRLYEVTRRIQPNVHYITDIETNTRLASSNETVPWIRLQALNLDGEIDLKTLFETSVGVPQGTMTADFLKTGQTRRNVFDPLLRVEEYRRAWEEMRASMSLVEGRTVGVDRDIVHLGDTVQQLPDVQTQLVSAEHRLGELIQDLERTTADLSRLHEQQAALDTSERRVAELAVVQREAEHRSALLSAQRDQCEVESRRATQAQALVSEAAPGYALVVAARAELASLESQRKERDRVNGELSSAQGDHKQISGTIQQLDRQLAETSAAATEAATLVTAVQRQIELEEQCEQALRIISTRESLEHRMTQQRAHILALQIEIETVKNQLAHACAARDRVTKTVDLQTQIDEVTHRLGEIGPLTKEMKAITEEGVLLRQQQTSLIAKSQRRQELCLEQEKIAPVAAGFDSLQTRFYAVRDEQTRISAALEYQGQARLALAKRHCPLLDLECPAISSSPALLGRLDHRDQEFGIRQVTLATEQAQVEPKLRAAQDAQERLHTLRVDAAALESSDVQLKEVNAHLSACLERYRELETQVRNAPALEQQRTEMRALQAQTRVDEKSAAVIPALEEQRSRARGTLATSQTALDDLTAEREAMRVHEQTVHAVQAELRSMGKPRDRQQTLLSLVATQPKIEADIRIQHERSMAAAARVTLLSEELARFGSLDVQTDQQRNLLLQHQDAHDTYVRELPVAETLDASRAALAAAEELLTAARQVVTVARDQHLDAQRQYDPTLHAEVRRAVLTTEGRLGESRTQRQHQELEVERTKRELVHLLAVEERLQGRRTERRQLERTHAVLQFVRETIKESGPAVTAALLRSISESANDVYAEIMDDHASELRWDEDYDIVVQRGADERSFAQLSGGEQMSAALAVRLALLKEMSDVDFAFFDEPTQNMDLERRSNLADQIRAVRGFEQLIVISHDDTFEHHTENVIRLQKIGEETVAE